MILKLSNYFICLKKEHIRIFDGYILFASFIFSQQCHDNIQKY